MFNIFLIFLFLTTSAYAQIMPGGKAKSGQVAYTNRSNAFLKNQSFNGVGFFGVAPSSTEPTGDACTALQNLGIVSSCTVVATTNANLTGAITSVGNATSLGSFNSAALSGALTDETGSGAAVFATSPAFTTPSLGAATATTINKVTITAPASSATLTIADGKTLTATNTVNLNTMTDTDICTYTASGTVLNCATAPPAGSLVGTTATQTFTNKRNTPRITTLASSATPTINTDNTDVVTITALAAAITSMTTNLSGTPNAGDTLVFRIKDNGTARGITWGTSFAARGVALPTTTVLSKYLYVGFMWNEVTSTWDCIASAEE